MVHPEQVARVVLLLQRGEALVIVAVGRLEACLAFVVHHEVRVGAAEIERVNRLPIVLCPFLQGRRLARIGVDPGDHHRPGGIAAVPCCFVFRLAMDRAIDRIEMHAGGFARHLRSLLDMGVDRSVGQRLHEVALPVPLQAFRIEPVEHALQRRVGDRACKIDDRLEEVPRGRR